MFMSREHQREITPSASRLTSIWIVIVAFLSLPLWCQQNPSKEMVGWVPREILERPLTLRQGVGVVHQKVTTSSVQAQAFYDQGIACLNSYVWIEAARSFNQALRLDPSLAMAYLGLSDSYIGLQDVAEAAAAFQKAQSLAEKVSERERSWIDIHALYFTFLANSGDMQKYFAYRKGISDALAADPNDPFLWILRGFADEGTPIAHGQNGGVDTIAFYQTAISLAPDSFVGHHYLAHTFENTGPMDQALEQSALYAKLAPSIPHAHHMHGHELRMAGRIDEAIAEFRKADELENAYYRTENIPAKYDWHHAHNLQLLAMCFQTKGEMKAAESAYREAFALPSYSDLADYNRKAWPEFLLARGRAEEALDAAQSLIQSRWSLAQFAGHSLAGRALLRLGRDSDAEQEAKTAEQQLQQFPTGASDRFPDAARLRAEILLRNKKIEEGNAQMNQVEEQLLALPGPDSWSATLFQLESIATLARQLQDWDLAQSTAQKIKDHDPSYAGGYYALALSAQHRGDATLAKQYLATADRLWSTSDADIRAQLRLR